MCFQFTLCGAFSWNRQFFDVFVTVQRFCNQPELNILITYASIWRNLNYRSLTLIGIGTSNKCIKGIYLMCSAPFFRYVRQNIIRNDNKRCNSEWPGYRVRLVLVKCEESVAKIQLGKWFCDVQFARVAKQFYKTIPNTIRKTFFHLKPQCTTWIWKMRKTTNVSSRAVLDSSNLDNVNPSIQRTFKCYPCCLEQR